MASSSTSISSLSSTEVMSTSSGSSQSTELMSTSSASTVMMSTSSQTNSTSSDSSSTEIIPFEVKVNITGGIQEVIDFTGNVDITIDWGDISTNHYVGASASATHNYAIDGEYNIKIEGQADRFTFNTTSADTLIEVITPCTIRNVTSFYYTFGYCHFLTSIPAGLFDNSIGATDFYYTFRNCSLLAAIPSGLFDNNINVASFEGTFRSCTSITSIPLGLFDNNTSVTIFSNAFNGCAAITSLVPVLWNRDPEPTGTNCYTNCSSAINYDAIPGTWGGPLVSSSSSSLSSSSSSSLSSSSTEMMTSSSNYGYMNPPENIVLTVSAQTFTVHITWDWFNTLGNIPAVPTGFIIERKIGTGDYEVVAFNIGGAERSYDDMLSAANAAKVIVNAEHLIYRIRSYWISPS